MSYFLDWDSGAYGSLIVDQVYEADRPVQSKLLDSKGNPLLYKKQKLGFDLSKPQKGN